VDGIEYLPHHAVPFEFGHRVTQKLSSLGAASPRRETRRRRTRDEVDHNRRHACSWVADHADSKHVEKLAVNGVSQHSSRRIAKGGPGCADGCVQRCVDGVDVVGVSWFQRLSGVELSAVVV
jgi:hypothetical protein